MKKISVLLYLALQLALAAAILETSCYFFLTRSSNPQYRALRILQQNQLWGWQSKPNLDTTFESKRLFTEDNGFRVEQPSKLIDFAKVDLLTLGPSSAFGWGVDAESTYTSQIARKLKLRSLNASQIGFSTEQGLILWNDFLKDKLPNLKYVFISYGINDLDRFRFFDLSFTDDVAYFQNTHRRTNLLIPNLNSNFLTSLLLFKKEAALRIDCSPLKIIRQRLSLAEIAQETLILVKKLKERHLKVILVGTPYLRMPAKDNFKYEEVEKLYSEAEVAAASNHCSDSLNFVNKAKLLEPWRVEQDLKKVTEIQKTISHDEKIEFIDTYSAFNNISDQKDYFLDPVHPSVKGHELMAQLILAKLK